MLAAFLVAGLLTSCVSEDEQPPPAAWTDPAWFAEQARGREEARGALQSCMDGRGWDVPVTEIGGTANVGFATMAEAESFTAEVTACMQENGLRTGLLEVTEAEAKEIYARQLDTLACMRAHGVMLPDPSTEQTFVESTIRFYAGGVTDAETLPWDPYGDFSDLQAQEAITPEVARAAEAACPQNWVS